MATGACQDGALRLPVEIGRQLEECIHAGRTRRSDEKCHAIVEAPSPADEEQWWVDLLRFAGARAPGYDLESPEVSTDVETPDIDDLPFIRITLQPECVPVENEPVDEHAASDSLRSHVAQDAAGKQGGAEEQNSRS